MMKRYNFDQKIDRHGTMCEKYDNLDQVFGTSDLIPLWVADSDFAVGDFILDAIKSRLEHPILGYSFRGDRYKNAVINWVKQRSSWQIDPSWVEFTPGVVCGLAFGVQAYSKVGDGVVIQPPVYPPFARTVQLNGRRVIENPLKEVGGRYEIDFEDLDQKLSNAKVFILCNPHNPTGRAFTKEELLKIGELCLKHGVMIVSDEIHADLIFKPNEHIHMASLSKEIADITLTYIAPSKTFNTAGLSTSVAIIPSPVAMQRYQEQAATIHADQGNIFGAVSLVAAYENGESWLEEQLEYLKANIDYVISYTREHMPKIKITKPEATYLLWLDCRELGLTQEQLDSFFVKEAHVGLNSGATFGKEGEGFVRMNVATTLDTLKQALSQMQSAYQLRGF